MFLCAMRIEHDTIAQAILNAPGWARVGITAPDARMREDAARELAVVILGNVSEVDPEDDQLRLAL